MMDGVMNLCRVKFRDHQRLHAADARRVLGADLPGHGRRAARRQRFRRRPARQRDPLQAARRQRLALRRGAGSGVGRRSPSASARTSACPTSRTTRASPRSPSGARTSSWCGRCINKFAEKYTKRELMAILNPLDVPCGPIMSTEDLATDEHVRGRDMWVELDHPQRGKWFNVGMPIKLSASPAKIERSPDARRAHRRGAEGGARLQRRQDRHAEGGGRDEQASQRLMR